MSLSTGKRGVQRAAEILRLFVKASGQRKERHAQNLSAFSQLVCAGRNSFFSQMIHRCHHPACRQSGLHGAGSLLPLPRLSAADQAQRVRIRVLRGARGVTSIIEKPSRPRSPPLSGVSRGKMNPPGRNRGRSLHGPRQNHALAVRVRAGIVGNLPRRPALIFSSYNTGMPGPSERRPGPKIHGSPRFRVCFLQMQSSEMIGLF